MNRLRGLTDLVQDAVHHCTIAVEKVHQSVARTPLDVLAIVPPLTAAARWIADVQSKLIATTYETIRETTAEVGALAAACIDAAARLRGPRNARSEQRTRRDEEPGLLTANRARERGATSPDPRRR